MIFIDFECLVRGKLAETFMKATTECKGSRSWVYPKDLSVVNGWKEQTETDHSELSVVLQGLVDYSM